MPTLIVDDAAKSFDGLLALDLRGCRLAFCPGQVTAVLGGNGAGKTTLFNIISGVISQDHGSVFLGETKLNDIHSWKRAQMGLARLWQDLRLFESLTAEENVHTAIPSQAAENPWIAIATRRVVDREHSRVSAQARHCLELVGLGDLYQARASDLSYGQQKLLAIARVTCNTGKAVVLLDEPTAGLDVKMTAKVQELIRGMCKENLVVVLVEHDLRSIRDLVDNVVFLDQGKCIVEGSLSDVLDCKSVRQRYMGIR